MTHIGANLNRYQGIQCLVAKSPQELCDLMNAIKVEYDVVAMTADSARHILYFVPRVPVLIKQKSKKEKINGNSNESSN